ncbi:MAG TPA: DMT family transporter [Planctomycetota bacterium]|nr:DMT family transporter [Planctomycetota bacterium]
MRSWVGILWLAIALWSGSILPRAHSADNDNWGAVSFCPAHTGAMVTADVGKCIECGHGTSSGMYKYCAACARRLKRCQICGIPVGEPVPVATPLTPAPNDGERTNIVPTPPISTPHNGPPDPKFSTTAVTSTVGGSPVAQDPSWASYLWLVGAMLCMAGMVLAYRASSKPEYHRHSVLVGAYLTSCAVSVALGLWRSGPVFYQRVVECAGSMILPLGIVGGILVVLSAELYLRSTHMGPMSITWTIRQMESVPATIVSFLNFAGEFTVFRLVGIVLLIPALSLFGWDKRIQEERKAAATANQPGADLAAEHRPSPWMWYAILSALLLGSYRICALWVQQDQIPQFMLFMYGSCVLFALANVAFDRHRIQAPEFAAGAFLGLLSSVQLFCSLNSQTTIGKVITLGTLAVSVPAIVTLISVGLYGEKIHWRSWLGLTVALGALACMFKWSELGGK